MINPKERERWENRSEVMKAIGNTMDDIIKKYLKPVEEYWQPSDFLPKSEGEDFAEEIQEIQELSKDLSYDLMVVIIGDMITEEALPTYESWLYRIDSISDDLESPWAQWVRSWTAEENRHGDLLNKYLYLTGRVNMKEMEITTHYLLNDGLDVGTGKDPYKNFIYTSFQELATNISHRRVAGLVKQSGNKALAKICGVIAADEMRHAKAYKDFVSRIFKVDASEMMLAFEAMMKYKIVMPNMNLRQRSQKVGELFDHFSHTAQRIGVYTSQDYIDILRSLIDEWEISSMRGLNDRAQRARDYIMALPERLHRISERIRIPSESYKFTWVD